MLLYTRIAHSNPERKTQGLVVIYVSAPSFCWHCCMLVMTSILNYGSWSRCSTITEKDKKRKQGGLWKKNLRKVLVRAETILSFNITQKQILCCKQLCRCSQLVPAKAPWCERQRHVVTSARMGTEESAAKCVILHSNRFSIPTSNQWNHCPILCLAC